MWRAISKYSLDDAAARAQSFLPSGETITAETVRRYENGRFPIGGPEPVKLAALALAYDRDPCELPPEGLKKLAQLAGIVDLVRMTSSRKLDIPCYANNPQVAA